MVKYKSGSYFVHLIHESVERFVFSDIQQG
jgi:hypothetical protein